MDNRNLGNCVPCEDRGHECPAVETIDVHGESEPWCADCKAGKRVCAYEREKRAKEAGISVRPHIEATSAHETKALVHKPAATGFCKCSPSCDKPAMKGRIYAWGHKPAKFSDVTDLVDIKQVDEIPTRRGYTLEFKDATAVKKSAEKLPFNLKTLTREEYEKKFTPTKRRDERIVSLIALIDKSPFGAIHILEPDKDDTPAKLRGRIRSAFFANHKKAKYRLAIYRNKKHNHVAIEKVQR